MHQDHVLDELAEGAGLEWTRCGGDRECVAIAREGDEIEVHGTPSDSDRAAEPLAPESST